MIIGNTAKSPAARRAYEERREALIKEFAPTIKYLASRLAVRLPSYLDAEDLFSVGLIGLLNAFDRYDPTREAKFKTYAEYAFGVRCRRRYDRWTGFPDRCAIASPCCSGPARGCRSDWDARSEEEMGRRPWG